MSQIPVFVYFGSGPRRAVLGLNHALGFEFNHSWPSLRVGQTFWRELKYLQLITTLRYLHIGHNFG
jgi:hypothetical protein